MPNSELDLDVDLPEPLGGPHQWQKKGKIQTLMSGSEMWVQGWAEKNQNYIDNATQYLDDGSHCLNVQIVIKALSRYAEPIQRRVIMEGILPMMKGNVLPVLDQLENSGSFDKYVMMQSLTDSSGFKYHALSTIRQKYEDRFKLFERDTVNLATLSKTMSYTHHYAVCMGCGRQGSFGPIHWPIARFWLPRQWFAFDKNGSIIEGKQRLKLQFKYNEAFIGVAAYCTECRVKCGGCGKMLPKQFDEDWVACLIGDGKCPHCGGERLVNVKAPSPDRRLLGQISRRLIIG